MSKKDCDLYLRKILGESNVILSGASDAQLRVQLFDTLEEFFDGSNSWQELLSITVVPDTLDYALIPANGGQIIRLLGVYDSNRVPQAATMPDINTLHFLYPYNNTQSMTAIVVKNVTDPLKCYPPFIPDWVLPVHGRGILAGILGGMMIQPGTSYFNPTLANFHLRKFRDAISKARVATMKANAVGTQSWVFPQAYRTSSQKGGVSTFNVYPTPRTQ
jgi:hypothetical protein